jgi:long-subunit acyl-CoA synthetase (AMP-forming)
MVSGIIEALSETPAERIAILDGAGALSYSELRSAVSAQARWLHDHGVVRCALLADNGTSWVTADLALLALRALNIPIPAWFTTAQVAHVLEDAGIDSMLTDAPDRIVRDQPEFRCVDTLPGAGLSLLRRSPPERAPKIAANVVKVTYTSGSTGAAKGVCLTLEALEDVARSVAHSVPPGMARHLCTMPLVTLLENLAGVYVPLLLGSTCIVPSPRVTGVNYGAPDAAALVAAISTFRPTSLILVPELLRLLVVMSRRGWRAPEELKFIAVGGACVSPQLLEEAEALGLPAFEGYGLSECTSVVCLNTPQAARRGSVGKPLAHADVRLDRNGQILVRGASMSGYLGQPPHVAGYYETGDLGFVDADGYVYVRGRLKNMFITSMGRNVSPEWVEAELAQEAAILRAVVIGEARPYPVALVMPAAEPADARHLELAIARANSRLPDYAQVRRHSVLPKPLTFADGLLTANGRPRRDAISQRYAPLIERLYETALAS